MNIFRTRRPRRTSTILSGFRELVDELNARAELNDAEAGELSRQRDDIQAQIAELKAERNEAEIAAGRIRDLIGA